ncbi:hypothetical protein R6Q59_021166 [Mikania micrantha]
MEDGTLTPETREILLHSILHYLHRGGFMKTLKRFQSKAQIQCLGSLYATFLLAVESLRNVKHVSTHNCQTEDNVVGESESKTEKKKKNKTDSASGDEVKETESEAIKKPVDDTMNSLVINESKKKTQRKEVKERRTRVNAHKNEKPEINEVEISKSRKSVKKQRIGSAEPKTVNAFQRVKIDQVEFAHEKLQDNSYWVKDGADIGYGAKAQEVLGQVKGRFYKYASIRFMLV